MRAATATSPSAESAPSSHRAGITAAHPDVIHAIESTFAGLATVCSGDAVSRPLRVPFEAAGRGRCPECLRRAADPSGATASQGMIVL